MTTTKARSTITAQSTTDLIGKLSLLEFEGNKLTLAELTDLAWEAKPIIDRLLSAAPKREASTIVSIAATKKTIDTLTGTDHDAAPTILPSSLMISGLIQARSTIIQHKRIISGR